LGQGEALAIATSLSKIGASQSALVVFSTIVPGVGAGNAMGRHVVISNDGVWIYLFLLSFVQMFGQLQQTEELYGKHAVTVFPIHLPLLFWLHFSKRYFAKLDTFDPVMKCLEIVQTCRVADERLMVSFMIGLFFSALFLSLHRPRFMRRLQTSTRLPASTT